MTQKLTTFDFRVVAKEEDKFVVGFLGGLVHTTLFCCPG
jgi:hypothetical protein